MFMTFFYSKIIKQTEVLGTILFALQIKSLVFSVHNPSSRTRNVLGTILILRIKITRNVLGTILFAQQIKTLELTKISLYLA